MVGRRLKRNPSAKRRISLSKTPKSWIGSGSPAQGGSPKRRDVPMWQEPVPQGLHVRAQDGSPGTRTVANPSAVGTALNANRRWPPANAFVTHRAPVPQGRNSKAQDGSPGYDSR